MIVDPLLGDFSKVMMQRITVPHAPFCAYSVLATSTPKLKTRGFFLNDFILEASLGDKRFIALLKCLNATELSVETPFS